MNLLASSIGRLSRALGPRYRIDGELGSGGMATVYLAEDLKHQRQVAVKVMRPELSAGLAPDRFVREIRIAAQLQHPHIVPLFDSGDADGLLYYVMPYVDGETLRARLERGGRLALDDALRIAGEVADALDYSHRANVVHRDIKPGNILISGGHAMVVDFGIARAVSVAGRKNLTQTGHIVGTPAYMSPEQLAGEVQLDGRADIYALGCVVYEMLAGEPPFSGPTAVAVLVEQAKGQVTPLRRIRAEIPQGVEEAVTKALAKAATDRFESAAEFAGALAQPRLQPRLDFIQAIRGVKARATAIAVAATMVLTLVAAWLLSKPGGPEGGPVAPLDPHVVAIMPFRVTGADPRLGYLREGMVDLLAARLSGGSGPRAVDARSVLAAWHTSGGSEHQDLSQAAALTLARRLGAGQLVMGSVVGSAEQVIIDASILELPAGAQRAQASAVGPEDSLAVLVDRLTAGLLALKSGETEQRLGALTKTSLPALRAYLDGQAAYRGGRYEEASRHFERAFQIDTSFVLSAVALLTVTTFTTAIPPATVRRARDLAWRARELLSARDRAFLTGVVGPNYPAPSSAAERLAAFKGAVDVGPDRPEAWYELGDEYFHWGTVLEVERSLELAGTAFQRALTLDSSFVPALEHLIDLSVVLKDTAAARRLGERYLSLHGNAETADYYRWRLALTLGDTAALTELRSRLQDLSFQSLRRIMGYAAADGIGLEDAERAAELLLRRAATPDERVRNLSDVRAFFLKRGRPRAALQLAEARWEAAEIPRSVLRGWVSEALFGYGDREAAERALRTLAATSNAPLADDPKDRVEQYGDICTVEQWRVVHGETRSAERAIALLRSSAERGDSPTVVATNRQCATVLDAMLAVQTDPMDASEAVDRLDWLGRQGPPAVGHVNLYVMWAREAQGDVGGALAAGRRRYYAWAGNPQLATQLRETGRLAALMGDRNAAIQSYKHYLALRSDPEPALEAEAEHVRAELQKLLREDPL